MAHWLFFFVKAWKLYGVALDLLNVTLLSFRFALRKFAVSVRTAGVGGKIKSLTTSFNFATLTARFS
jgi:hypothetical protein